MPNITTNHAITHTNGLVNGGKNIQTNKEKCSICDLIPEVLIKSNWRNKFVV